MDRRGWTKFICAGFGQGRKGRGEEDEGRERRRVREKRKTEYLAALSLENTHVVKIRE